MRIMNMVIPTAQYVAEKIDRVYKLKWFVHDLPERVEVKSRYIDDCFIDRYTFADGSTLLVTVEAKSKRCIELLVSWSINGGEGRIVYSKFNGKD